MFIVHSTITLAFSGAHAHTGLRRGPLKNMQGRLRKDDEIVSTVSYLKNALSPIINKKVLAMFKNVVLLLKGYSLV